MEDVTNLMNVGADRVAINSAAIARPQLIREIADKYGSQAISISIEAKQTAKGIWTAFFDSGRESSKLEVFNWIATCEEMNAGEIILTSVDRDGTLKGPDTALIEKACSMTSIPIVVSGGFSKVSQIDQLRKIARFEGIAIGKAFHLGELSVEEVKSLFLGNVSS